MRTIAAIYRTNLYRLKVRKFQSDFISEREYTAQKVAESCLVQYYIAIISSCTLSWGVDSSLGRWWWWLRCCRVQNYTLCARWLCDMYDGYIYDANNDDAWIYIHINERVRPSCWIFGIYLKLNIFAFGGSELDGWIIVYTIWCPKGSWFSICRRFAQS